MKTNWTHCVVMVAVLCSTVAVAQGTEGTVKDDLFVGTEVFAKGASDVTEISMDPDTLGLVGGKEGHKAHNMILNVVRTYEYDKPGMYRLEDVEAFRNKLNTGNWHCSVHTRSLKTGESTDICDKRRTDDLAETAIITVEPKQLTFIHTIRRKSGSGQSELNGFMLMNSLRGLPKIAMLEPQLLELQMSLKNVQMPDMDAVREQVKDAMKNMPALDSAQIQKSLDDARKQLSDAQKQFDDKDKELKDKDKSMKQLDTPEFGQKLKDAQRHDRIVPDVD